MKKRLEFMHYADWDDNASQNLETLFEYPSVCPLCGVALDIKSKYSLVDSRENPKKVLAVFYCPKCTDCFIGEYRLKDRWDSELIGFKPQNTIQTKIFPDNIVNFCSLFCEIYNQAYQAEQYGLDKICGMGYRKAIEILIKDFAIKCYPDKSEEIKSRMLGYCIDNYIDIEKIKNLSKAVAWIGNDETHYEKRLIGADISKMKAFIGSVVDLINGELEYENALKLLNDNKK